MESPYDNRLKLQDIMYDDYQFIVDRGEIGKEYFMFHFKSLIHLGLSCRIMLLNKRYSFVVEGRGSTQFCDTFPELLKALKIALREFVIVRTANASKQRLSSRRSNSV